MNASGPILILTASAGAGHMVAARALEERFLEAAPDAEVVVHDVLQTTNSFFRALYSKGYLGLVNYVPLAMGILYEATDRPARFRRNTRTWFQSVNARPTTRFLMQRRPRLIVNTHFLPAELVAQLRRAGKLDCPQVTVTTDFETHRLWAQPPTERYYTASDEGKAYLATWGVPSDRVLVTGIPVRRDFRQPPSRDEARRRCGLADDARVALLLCGGFGVGPIERLFRELIGLQHTAQVVAIAGRNEALRKRLEQLAAGSSRPVRIIGFTETMHEWMSAADLVVTKPGGLTTSEALVCGLPIVIVNPIPGQETRNSDYLLERGAAIKVNNPRLLGYRVDHLLANPARLDALRQAARGIARSDATDAIVADAMRFLT